jgi:Zn/Cd-binding protein ZinT
LEDVAALKKIVQNKYYEGFNIISITNLDDISGEFQSIYPFSSNENKIL